MPPRGIALAAGAAVLGFLALLTLGLPLLAYTSLLVGMTVIAVASNVSPNLQIAVASVAGVGLGLLPDSGIEQIQLVGRLFIALLKMLIAPLILFAIVHGIGQLGGLRELGRIGAHTAALYLVTMALAVVTGLVAVNVFQPGAGSALRESAFFAGASAAPVLAPRSAEATPGGRGSTAAYEKSASLNVARRSIHHFGAPDISVFRSQ